MSYAIGIVAHTARAARSHELMHGVGAAFCSIDNGNLGCGGNHRKVWRHLSKRFAAHKTWLVVLEDDAVPVEGFAEQLEAALNVHAAPVVSLYLGRLRPPHYQYLIEPAVKRADEQDANFIVSPHVLHAVGLAIRSDLVADMLDNLDEELPIDEAIGEWVNKRHYRCAYTYPSIVDHQDGETLLTHRDQQPREPGRVAWRFGVRDNWQNTTMEMS